MITAQEAIESLLRARITQQDLWLGDVAELIRHQTKQIETADAIVNSLSGVLVNIADTCRSRGFLAGKPIDERVIALAQDRDRLRAQVESNVKLRSDILEDERNQDPSTGTLK